MKRTLNLLLLFLILAVPSFAGKVSKTEAQQIAQKFMTRQMHRSAKARFAAIPAKLRLSKSTDKEFAPFYVYNADNSQGFVIVSGDDAIGQIIGYSDTGSFEMENAPSNIVTMLQMFARLVENAPANAARRAPHIPDANPTKGNVVVSPLLDEEGIQWGQDAPFNGMMPSYVDKDNATINYYVGCVATAMAQIMRYHKYPAHGIGTSSYTTTYGTPATSHTLTADYGATTYDWSNMPGWLEKDNADATQNSQVATLSYQAAVSVHMSYAPGGSGSYSQAVTGAMVHHFGYDQGITYKKREYFSTTEWMDMIKTELQARRPVFYSASNEDGLGGHAYVCDGYDDQDFVHINWGWYGRSNGFFHVNALDPYELGIGANGGGYNLQQEIIIGIQKPLATPGKKPWDMYCSSRFTANLFELSGIDCMSMVDYHGCDPFTGKIAAVLIDKDGKVVAELGSQPWKVKGVNLDGKHLTDGGIVSLKKCTTSVPGVPNGSDYKILFAVQAQGETDWTIVRTMNTLPNYAQATVDNGVIIAVDQHKPTPDVTLLEKITPDGILYAKGSANFMVKVRNNTTDFYLSRIWLRFTDVNDPTKVYYLHEDDTKSNNVYDSSDKTLHLLIDLPQDMPAGKYRVEAFEKDYEDYLFNETLVGKTELEVVDEATTPIIRQIGDFAWLGKDDKQEVRQGDPIAISMPVRNYGVEGATGLLISFQDVNDPTKIYDFYQKDVNLTRQQFLKAIFAKRCDIMPGTYKLVAYYIVDGNTKAVEGEVGECIIEVKENPDLVLHCDEFAVPTHDVEAGKTYTGFTLKLSAKNAATKGTLFVRLRPATYTGGQGIVKMVKINLAANASGTVNFEFTPNSTLAKGKYLMFLEYRKDGDPRTAYGPVAGENTQPIYLGITAGIDDVNTTGASAADFTFDGRNIYFGDIKNIRNIAVYSISGAKVFSTSAVSSTVSLPLANGIYVLRVATVDGTVTKKIVFK